MIPTRSLALGMFLAPRDGTDPTPPAPTDPTPPAPTDPNAPPIDLSLYMPKAAFEKELARRVSTIVGKQKSEDDFLSDETFRQKALESWGVKPEDGQNAQKLTERLTQAQTEWEQKRLTPVQTKLQEAQGRVEKLLNRDLTAQILQAAGTLAQDALLTPPVKGAEPPIVNLLRAYFSMDEESAAWFAKDGDGFAFSATPTAESPYKTVSEFVQEWFAGPGKAFARDTRQRGPGMGQPGGPQHSKDINVRITEAEAAGDFGLANSLKVEKLRSL